jgi:hypothetical protein
MMDNFTLCALNNMNIAIVVAVVVFVQLMLAIPAVGDSWKRFFQMLVLSFVGIVLPIFIFLVSAFFAPFAKDCCRYGG